MTNNTNTQPIRKSSRVAIVTLSALIVSVFVAAGCGSDDPTSDAPSVSVAPVATTLATTIAAAPFHSDLYNYVVASPDWSGLSASVAWDGTGSPGSGDATVDILHASDTRQAYVFAGATTSTLEEFVAAGRAANAAARSCPETPAATSSISVSGEPGILDEVVCGVFAISATVMHGGRAYVFFTYDQPGKETEMREWFGSLLQTVVFDA